MKRLIGLIVISILIINLGLSIKGYALNLSTEPVGDPRAIKGGQLNLNTSDFPKSFNLYVSTTVDAKTAFNLVYDSLLELNYNTLDYQPLLAKSIDISPDKKEFLIKIDPRAKWADGKPVTSADIKFTYDVIMNPKNLTSVQRMLYSRFSPPVIIDKLTIKFIAKTVHYNNLFNLATELRILPKHLFEGKNFNKDFNMSLPPGSGPYTLSEVKEGRYYVFSRRKDYWADQLPHHRGLYNFNRIRYKVIRDDSVAFEAFKRGDFDAFSGITGKRWVKETSSVHFQKNWIVKQKVYNYAPSGFGGLAINMRKPLFQDLRVRQALFYLFDRKTILEKLEYNEAVPLTSYWPALYGFKPANFPIDYNPVKAKKLLSEAGYTRLDKAGYLINQKGERLEFTILNPNPEYEKHFTIYMDDCKRIGVKVNLELVSWATLVKKMDEYKFDMVCLGWSADIFEDPEQLWHSKHINEIGASNLSGYKNLEVDRLIDSLPPILDANKRNEIIKKIDSIVYRDVPYILFWGNNSYHLLYKNVFGMPKTVFPKYSAGIAKYWWIDPVKLKKYQEAVKKGKTLPRVPEEVYFDQNAPK
jgi:microcin C transport system substrate-binding protein